MRLYSTNNKNITVDLKTAVLNSLPPDNGLYMPTSIPKLPSNFLSELSNFSFEEIALEISSLLLGGALTESEILTLVSNSIDFPAPVVELDNQTHILELFHGPSLAFKDFGARYMSQLMSLLNKDETAELTILVATSGDTGGAVAAGFYNTPAIVKQAFLDDDLKNRYRLSSANSINISRLIPQSFYYFEAFKQVMHKKQPVVFSVPSGNFGNITAGILGKKMGLPVHRYIAATNSNKIVPDYLESGQYIPKPSLQTISNAMDVGNPSNFARMKDIYQSELQLFKEDLLGYWFNDSETKKGMKEVYELYNYVIDPHGAVAYLAHKDFISKSNVDISGIILETAHPSKFIDVVEPVLETEIEIPPRLAALKNKEKVSTRISHNFTEFKEWMMR